VKALVWIVALGACTGDIDAQWKLDHERIIAVRATPPHVPAGTQSTIDVFVGHKGAPVEVIAPTAVTVMSPESLIDAVTGATVTAPGDTLLNQVRSDLGLGPDDPVPLELEIEADGFEALKTVYLGDTGDNPTLDGLLVNNVPPPTDPTATITVDADVDVPLFVTGDDTVDNINWLTSCGTMNDFDLHSAFLHVNPTDPQSGQLAVVFRDDSGGVVWQVWSIQAE
jgi:hypothetical protein